MTAYDQPRGAKASPEAISRLIMQRLALFGLFVVLALVAIGFLVASLSLGLLNVVSPAAASLMTALIVGLGALAVRPTARYHRQRRPVRASAHDLLPALRLVVERHSLSALAASLALGAVAESTTKSSTRRGV